jgi:glycosyltransferase involved in cell wall biosynthesis
MTFGLVKIKMTQTIVILLNSTWNAYNFRSNLIRQLCDSGYKVIVVAPKDEYVEKVIQLGCEHYDIHLSGSSKSPISNFILLLHYLKVFRKLRPDLVLSFTIKPNIYGSLIARLMRVPIICNVAGLGVSFSKRNWVYFLVLVLSRMTLKQADYLFFQNKNDQIIFKNKKLVKDGRSILIPGSGVDLKRFKPITKHVNSSSKKIIKFIMISRLLKQKGIYEYIKSAEIIKKKYSHIDFHLVGFGEENNNLYVSECELKAFEEKGLIKFFGKADEVDQLLQSYDCVVLPSYYGEGVPRILLEASAMGKLCITTNSVGCVDAVENDVTGFICQPKNVRDLAHKMIEFINLSDQKRQKMKCAARAKMVREFDEKYILKIYLKTCEQLLKLN